VEAPTSPGGVCLAKSGNKHNRLFVRAEPLADEVVADLESGAISMAADELCRSSLLVERHGWSRQDARRVIACGSGCVLVNGTVGIDLTPVLDMVVLAFEEVGRAGPLCGEALRGVRFIITDAKYHPDTPHRRADQIVPMARRAFQAAFLAAEPSLREPVFSIEVQLPDFCLKPLRAVLQKRGGKIVQDTVMAGTPLHVVEATLPVSCSFGFVGDLQGATSGHAFPNCSFSHWQRPDGDAYTPTSTAGRIVQAVRQRKGMKEEVPSADSIRDRL
jgi:elongation factor 2